MLSLSTTYPALALFIVLSVLSLSGCQPSQNSQHTELAITTKPKHVILIGIDALSIDGLLQAETPALDKLMQNGAYTLNARAVLPSSSSPNWKSILSASAPNQHGVTSNSWAPYDFILPPVATGLEDIFPTIIGEYRQHYPNAKIGAFYTWGGINELFERSALNIDVNSETDEQTITRAIQYITAHKPEFTLLHLDNVDHVGHHDGHKTTEFYNAVNQVDRLVGTLLEALETAQMRDDTVIVIASDHGGIGYGHGGETLDEMQVPVIINGPGIKHDFRINKPVYTYDTGATVAYLLDIPLHPAWVGRPIVNAFIGQPALNSQAMSGAARLAAPTLLPKPHLYEPAGGFFANGAVTIEMQNNAPRSTLRYTIDGTKPTRSSPEYTGKFTVSHSVVVQAAAFGDEEQQSTVTTGYYRTSSGQAANGISVGYYEGNSWRFLPVFEQLTPIKTTQTHEFRIADIPLRDNQFGLRFSSYLKVTTGGEYTFYTYSDDGSTLSINGEVVVNNDGDHGTIMRSGKVQLEPGMAEITVDYFNGGGGAWLDVFYRPPGQVRQLIAPEMLYVSPQSGSSAPTRE
ncbi:alkaline phosphatase family protein [Alteromonas gilva]|uniref:Alkaline phosphatase family protein n=1 Tax=Alteromonas gilva TaxID=2987522 RepID=A0ABT5KYU7_9ALTE|nr:alkaline phosphatase family protein [Alteromonas gilva]MDC8829359.1 alkaline phosphatase family protein [Alteromonas gilva]